MMTLNHATRAGLNACPAWQHLAVQISALLDLIDRNGVPADRILVLCSGLAPVGGYVWFGEDAFAIILSSDHSPLPWFVAPDKAEAFRSCSRAITAQIVQQEAVELRAMTVCRAFARIEFFPDGHGPVMFGAFRIGGGAPFFEKREARWAPDLARLAHRLADGESRILSLGDPFAAALSAHEHLELAQYRAEIMDEDLRSYLEAAGPDHRTVLRRCGDIAVATNEAPGMSFMLGAVPI